MVYALVCSEYLAIIIRKYIKACRTELIAWTTTLLSRNVPDSKVQLIWRSTGVWSSNELQWVDLKSDHEDNNPFNGRQGDND